MNTILAAALSIGGGILRCKPCLAVIAALALLVGGGVYGVKVERARADARIERMKQAAAQAAAQRDAGIRAELEDRYAPRLAELEQQKKSLEGEVEKYARTKPPKVVGKADGKCTIGPDALRLRKPPNR